MSHFTVMVIGEQPETQLAPFQENNRGDCPKEFLKFNEDKDCQLDETIGKHGYWENPNAKWDWYQLGGRWSGLIKVKDGSTGGRKGRGSLVYKNEVGIDSARKYDIANLNELQTFAVLKDGKWYERGEMGWWGMVHNEKDEDTWNREFKKLISDLPDDTLISIYDCHI